MVNFEYLVDYFTEGKNILFLQIQREYQGMEVSKDRFQLTKRKNSLMIQVIWKQNDLPFEIVIFLLLKAFRGKLFDIHDASCIRDSCKLTKHFNYAKILCCVPSLPVPLVNQWSMVVLMVRKIFFV